MDAPGCAGEASMCPGELRFILHTQDGPMYSQATISHILTQFGQKLDLGPFYIQVLNIIVSKSK